MTLKGGVTFIWSLGKSWLIYQTGFNPLSLSPRPYEVGLSKTSWATEDAGNQHFLQYQYFNAPASKDWGHIVLPVSVCLCLCLISDLHCPHFHSRLSLNCFFISQWKFIFSQWKTTIYFFSIERVSLLPVILDNGIIVWNLQNKTSLHDHQYFENETLINSHRRGGLVIWASASWAGSIPYKVFKIGSSGFPPWRPGLWERHYDYSQCQDNWLVKRWLKLSRKHEFENCLR